MSASMCIKCESFVGGYQKYCQECVDTYGVKQDETWGKRPHFIGFDWDVARKAEFEKDLEHAQVTKKVHEAEKALIELRKRSACIGRCGRLVKSGTECRKCRKSRLRKGLKHRFKVEDINNLSVALNDTN